MALLLETDLGDLVIDLDVAGSPELCCNFIKLAKARYYTSTLLHSVHAPTGFCGAGDPAANGTGGACVYGLIDTYNTANMNTDKSGAVPDVTQSQQRFLKSRGRVLTEEECHERGRVVAVELNGVADTIGSQFWMTLGNTDADQTLLEEGQKLLSLGTVVEDPDHVLDQIAAAYCDPAGRPYADIRIMRALVVHDPFEDPVGFQDLLSARGVVLATKQEEDDNNDKDADKVVTDSPSPDRPPEEKVPIRISVKEVDLEDTEVDQEQLRQQEAQALRKEDHGRAVVLEMLGDLPSAEITAPDTVLFCCKLNPVTVDEDLELIFSRFDPAVKVEIIRDASTGQSLQYAFCEFTTKQQAAEAYLKMNNVLVDDRRISVDFSQSVSKMWDKYNQKLRMPKNVTNVNAGGRGGGGRGRGGGRGGGERQGRGPVDTNNTSSHGGRGRGGGRGGRGGHHHGENRRDDGWGQGRGPPVGENRRDGGWSQGRGPPTNQRDSYRSSPDNNFHSSQNNRPHQSHHSHSNGRDGMSGRGGGGPGPSPHPDSGRPDEFGRSSRQHEHEPRYDRDNEDRRNYRKGDEDSRDRRRGDSSRRIDYDREQDREDRRHDRDRRDGGESSKHARGQDRPKDNGRDSDRHEHDRGRDRERSRDRSRGDRRDRDRHDDNDEKKSRDRHPDRDNGGRDGSRDDRRDRDRDRHPDRDNDDNRHRDDDNFEKKNRDRDRHSDRNNRDNDEDNGDDRRSSPSKHRKHEKGDRSPDEKRSESHRSGENKKTHDEERGRKRRDKDEARGRDHERKDKDEKRHRKHHKHHKRDRQEKGDSSREGGDDDRRRKKRHRLSRSRS